MANNDGLHVPLSHVVELHVEPFHLLVPRLRVRVTTVHSGIRIVKVPGNLLAGVPTRQTSKRNIQGIER